MGASVTLQPSNLSVEPGGSVSVEVSITNTGAIVDQFTIEVVGDAASWAAAEPPVVPLFPNATGTARVTFSPPRLATTKPGSMPFGVMARSHEDPTDSSVEEGALEITVFHDLSAELVPRTSRGRRSGRHEVAVDNRGNAGVVTALAGFDAEKQVGFAFSPATISVEPGSAAFASVRVRPVRTFWRGPSRTHPFAVTAAAEGAPPIPLDGTMLQEALLPSGTVRLIMALLGAVLIAALLWVMVLAPQIKSMTNQVLADYGISPAPGSSAASPGGNGGGGGGGPTPSPTATATTPGGSQPTPPVATPGPTPAGTPVVAPQRTDGRLQVTAGKSVSTNPPSTLSITDLVFANPTGANGQIVLKRDDTQLLTLRLDYFRSLDFHFVTPIVIPKDHALTLTTDCTGDCSPSVFYSGLLTP